MYFCVVNVTDTHTHLYIDAFDQDREEMMQRAIEAGVNRFFIPAIDSTYTTAMFDLEKNYPEKVFLMNGLHPTYVKENYKNELQYVDFLMSQRSFVAIGEIGIDLYWDKSTLKNQQEAFRHQIKLAKKYKLPIVIHSRESFDEVFEILEEEKGDDLFGIFHCFTGTFEQAQKAISYNMKLGIGGVVTFKNGRIDKFIDKIELQHIVLETDSPYLAPTPHRGKRNESSYIIRVLEKLSELYKLPIEKIAEITTNNALEIFKV